MDTLSGAAGLAFLARLYKIQKSYCTTPGVGVGVGIDGSVGVDKMLKFYVKVFYVMGKALSGELSCTRTGLSCFSIFHNEGQL